MTDDIADTLLVATRDIRTIPEQIADQIAASIIDGAYNDGDRLTEEEVAAAFQVSRSPVREAFQHLARRGLLQILPRRGAFVIGSSMEMIADLFNIRAVLLGLTGRYFATHHTLEQRREFDGRVEVFLAYCTSRDARPAEVARMAAWAFRPVIEHCNARALMHMLDEHAVATLWGFIWRGEGLDFGTAQRRRAYAADYRLIAALIAERKGRELEELLRRMMFESRDVVLRSLVKARGGAIDPDRCISDDEEVSASMKT